MPLNPKSARDEVNYYSRKNFTNQVSSYPLFFTKLRLDKFRHLNNIILKFEHPISVISGSNRSGKTTTLMAIACSHYNFMRHNVTNGAWERATWGVMMRFTPNDIQTSDWNYYVSYREGSVEHNDVHGYRLQASKKWGGAAKKSKQIGKPTSGHPDGGRTVTLIDLNRITPGRHLSKSYYNKARLASPVNIPDKDKINLYLSYILEETYDVESLVKAADGNVYKYANTHTYSSFNTASGEDVLTSLLADIVHTPQKSLILIDEIEIGLHPKIQRLLMDVLYMISKDEQKQFIITTHSYAILNSVPSESRLFIDNNSGTYRVFEGLSTYEALTRMDSEIFPVTTIYVEDEESKFIVDCAISELNAANTGFARLLKVVVVGSADKTYNYFVTRKQLRSQEHITTRAACILDGDMKEARDSDRQLKYPPQDGLFFHYSNEAPEKMLLRCYLTTHPNETLQYHYENSNPHCLMQKMCEEGFAIDKNDALTQCFNEYYNSDDGHAHFEELKTFIQAMCV